MGTGAHTVSMRFTAAMVQPSFEAFGLPAVSFYVDMAPVGCVYEPNNSENSDLRIVSIIVSPLLLI